MTDLETISLKLEKELYNLLKTNCINGQMSEFIRQAIIEKIDRKKISADETYHRIKQIDKLDTQSIHSKVIDIEFTIQVIYEEIKKQNQILKLVLRRVTFSSMFGRNILDLVANSEVQGDELEDEALKTIQEEINELKF